jgi:hypothetical protein
MTNRRNAHESMERQTEVEIGSERAFGFEIFVVFAAVALWPSTGDGAIRVWAAVFSDDRPPLNWSRSYHQEGRTKDVNQASRTGKNRRQAAPGRGDDWPGNGPY